MRGELRTVWLECVQRFHDCAMEPVDVALAMWAVLPWRVRLWEWLRP